MAACCFNSFAPKSTNVKFIIKATGCAICCGISSDYDEYCYDKEILGKYMSEQEFKREMEDFNSVIFGEWPCPGSICCGFCWAPCTLGLTLLIPKYFQWQAEKRLKAMIDLKNNNLFKHRGV